MVYVLFFFSLISVLVVNSIIAAHEPFLWGTATAAYQTEGCTSCEGRESCIWDDFSHVKGKIARDENGDIADDSYNQMLKDVSLLVDMKVNAYRFSLSWSRIIPDGVGEINPLAIAHYNRLIDALVENNIVPLVTLYHWDLPSALESRGGWLDADIESSFSSYAAVCFEAFGDRVRYWITINEPWTFSYLGYVAGKFAPGRCSNRTVCQAGDSTTEGYVVAHNVLNSHAAAVELYRSKYQASQGGQIGITLNQDWAEPMTDAPADIAAAQRANEFLMGWFGDPVVLGDYPLVMRERVGDRLPVFSPAQSARLAGSFDFWALNHYTSKYVSERPAYFSAPPLDGGGWAEDCGVIESKISIKSGRLIGPQGASPWLHMVPWGFYKVLEWNYRRYNEVGLARKPLTIIVTENGCDVPGESDMTLQQALNDTFRIQYYSSYIAEMERAMQAGIRIAGYMAWSLLDNFEWADGYAFRFGLHYVNYTDPRRSRFAKQSAHWYSHYVQEHPTYALQPHRPDAVPLDNLNDNDMERRRNGDISERACSWSDYLTTAFAEAAKYAALGMFGVFD